MRKRNDLLLVLAPLQAKDQYGAMFYEKQASNGISRWAENFDQVTVACAALPYESRDSTFEYLPLSQIEHIERIRFVELPHSWNLIKFVGLYENTKEMLAELISENQYLCFGIGGLIGDWGSVACLEAHRMQRRYSVWTDRVEHLVVKASHRDKQGLGRITRWAKTRIEAPIMASLEKAVIKRSSLGLFHGADCFDAYADFNENPFLVHDIHLKKEDQASNEAIEEKCKIILSGSPIQIVYAGRVAAMKGPLEWIEALEVAHKSGIKFCATWLGDGPLIAEAKTKIAELNLTDHINFAGMVTDRDELLKILRAAHIFVFCHKTPESPRVLIEALMSGTPIVGYQSHYAADLLGNGNLAKDLLLDQNPKMLGEKICKLVSDRPALATLIRQSAEMGRQFSDEAVFEHRSELIKKYAC